MRRADTHQPANQPASQPASQPTIGSRTATGEQILILQFVNSATESERERERESGRGKEREREKERGRDREIYAAVHALSRRREISEQRSLSLSLSLSSSRVPFRSRMLHSVSRHRSRYAKSRPVCAGRCSTRVAPLLLH